MDANRLRFWMIADAGQWVLLTPSSVHYDASTRRLALTSQRAPLALVEDPTEAARRVSLVPGSIDAFGTWASWDSASGAVRGTGIAPGSVPIFTPPAGAAPTDVTVGYDGALYVAVAGATFLHDLRDVWDDASTSLAGFAVWRLAADPSGGAWALAGPPAAGAPIRIARVRGTPLPRVLLGTDFAPTVFRPRPENATPPATVDVLDATLAGEQAIAIAASDGGQIALLTWVAGAEARVRLLSTTFGRTTLGPPTTLAGVRFPYSLAWVSEAEIAVLVTGLPGEALVYPIGASGGVAMAGGDFYPLGGHDGGPLLHGTESPPRYGVVKATGSNAPAAPRPLAPISLPAFAALGSAASYDASGAAGSPAPIDSGSARTVWHRLYLEARIPPNCGVRVMLAATDVATPPAATDARSWHEHRFGRVQGASADVPQGVWVPSPSELPFHEGLLGCAPEPHVAGLFTVLVQRPGRATRSLRGRFLWIRVDLASDGRSAPELAALRAYASRFSYVENYLPELYRETVFGDDADATGPATPADFLERMLDNCEGILTGIEDRVASSYLLTDARTAPEDGLDWLASWVGYTFDDAVPVDRRRVLLASAGALAQQRGTLAGLKLALDGATGGAVSDGRVLVVEDFALRRTFATLLGVDLSDPNDPLLPGLTISGNSYVGDTLFLGSAFEQQVLAIFAPGLKGAAQSAAVSAFFDRLAMRVTVLVHQDVDPVDLGLVRRIVAAEAPAHVIATVVVAPQPFIVGVASLLGVDSYLSAPPLAQAVTLGTSRVGAGDLIERPPTLDPRSEGGAE